MVYKTRLAIIVMLLIYNFQTNVFACENIWEVSFLAFDSEGESYWISESVVFDSSLSKEEKTKYIFTRLFEGDSKQNIYTFPKGIDIYSVLFKDDLLIINISGNILYYNQGSYYETILKNKIVRTALNIKNINKVTLLIEGDIGQLRKGSMIYRVSHYSLALL